MRHFELEAGSSNKFWEVEAQGVALTIRFGRNGSTRQTSVKTFADATCVST